MLRIEDHVIVRDRFAHPGDAPIDLNKILQPREWPAEYAPTSYVLEPNSHFTLNGTTLDVSAAGDAADLDGGVYLLHLTAQRAPLAPCSAILTVYAFADTRYVAPDSGDDSADGLTMATAWRHAPGESGAAAAAADFAPTVMTLINIKGGTRLGPIQQVNRCHYGSYGWGVGKPEVTTMTPLPAGNPAAAGDTLNNPQTANIRKFAVSLTHSTPIRDGVGFEAPLAFPAQWPAAGANRFLESQDPRFNGTRGMRQLPLSAIEDLGDGGGGQRIYRITDPGLAAAYPGIDVTGRTCNLWVTANHVHPAVIELHEPGLNRWTFRSKPYLSGQTVIAFNLVGHPAFIAGPGQYAWNQTATELLAWFAAPQAEIATATVAMRFTALNTDNGASNIRLSGGHSTVTSGISGGAYCGVSIAGATLTHMILDVDFRHILSDRDQAACIRTHTSSVTGKIYNWKVYRCTVEETNRSSGFRFSNQDNRGHEFVGNWLRHIGFTSYYVLNAKNCLFQSNYNLDCQSPHGNVYTLYIENRDQPTYGYGKDVTIRYCETRNCTRPLTSDFVENLVIERSIFEVDATAQAFQPWMDLINQQITGSYFALKAGTAADETKWAAWLRGSGMVTHCVFDGLVISTSNIPTFQDCLLTQHTTQTPELEDLAAPSARNVYSAQPPWDGVTISPKRKQTLGAGWLGTRFAISGVSNVEFADVINAAPGQLYMVGPAQLRTDRASITIQCPAGVTMRATSDLGGANVLVDWASTLAAVPDGAYLWVRANASTTSNYESVHLLDLGDGNLIPWRIKTKRASGWPNVEFGLEDNLRTAANVALGVGTSPYMTGQLTMLWSAFPAGTSTVIGPTTGSLWWQITVLPSGKLRILGRNAAGTAQVQFDTPQAFTLNAESTLAWTVDLTKATAAEGVLVSLDGGPPLPPGGTPTWTGPVGSINWGGVHTWNFGNSKVAGVVGCFFLDQRLADLTSADVRERLTNPLRLGPNGENVFGDPPNVLILGKQADYNSAGGINRGKGAGVGAGAGAKFVAQAGTAVASAPASETNWPAFQYATEVRLTGPSTLREGQVGAFEISLDGALMNPIAVALGGGPGWAQASVTLQPGVDPKATVTFTAGAAELRQLIATAPGLSAAGRSLLIERPPATSYDFQLGAAAAPIGVEVPYRVELNGSNLEGVSIDPGVNGFSARFEPELILPPGVTVLEGVMIPITVGLGHLAPASTLVDPAPIPFEAQISYLPITKGAARNLTPDELSGLRVSMMGLPPGLLDGVVQVRYRSGLGESGPLAGVDLRLRAT